MHLPREKERLRAKEKAAEGYRVAVSPPETRATAVNMILRIRLHLTTLPMKSERAPGPAASRAY